LVDIGAPLGKSYRCWAQKQFPLLNGRDNATLLLGNFQLQPFLDGQKVFGEGRRPRCAHQNFSLSLRQQQHIKIIINKNNNNNKTKRI
jgi:hypothetical protein